MVSVDIMPFTLLTSNMQSAWYLLVSGMTADLTNLWVVALRVSVACAKLSPHLSLRSSCVVLECCLNDKNVLDSPMSLRVYAFSSLWPVLRLLTLAVLSLFSVFAILKLFALAILRLFSWRHNCCYYSC